MDNLDVAPLPVEILRDETPMAMVRLVLAAEQTRVLERSRRNGLLDATASHEFEEALLVRYPFAFQLLVVVEEDVRRRQLGAMNDPRSKPLPCKGISNPF